MKNNNLIINLSHGGIFDVTQNTYFCGHNEGFFSNCTVMMWNLFELNSKNYNFPNKINFSRSFASFKNNEDQKLNTDLYPFFFERDKSRLKEVKKIIKIDQHANYNTIPYKSFELIIDSYFKFSDRVIQLTKKIVHDYSINLNKTIAVVYRGTDKGSEVWLASPEAYLKQAKTLLKAYPNYKVWIQTDEVKVRDLFCNELGESCFYLKEMPVSKTGSAIHMQDDSDLQFDRTEFGIKLVVVTNLLSKAAFVVNHTGNMALWICLFRGNARKVIQFDRNGEKVGLRNADNFVIILRHFYFKVFNFIRRKF